eukprot:259149_1
MCCFLLSISIIIVISNSEYYLRTELLIWKDHEALCSFYYGSNLASIHNNSQNEMAKTLCPASTESNCWIGLNDRKIQMQFNWTDETKFDFGININGQMYPWGTPNQPDNYQGQQDCCIIDNDFLWRDTECSKYLYSLCNAPYFDRIIYDKYNYPRAVTQNNILGTMSILDEINIEFDVVVHSFPQNNTKTNILRIGNVIWINIFEAGLFEIIWSTVSNATNIFMYQLNILLYLSYHIHFEVTQQHLLFIVDTHIVYNHSIPSHSIFKNQNIYLSNDSTHSNKRHDMTLMGLMISTTNTYDPYHFNYLCDYNNRFSNIKGGSSWNIDTNSCWLTQSDVNAQGNVVWIGNKDINSISWVNYKVEIVMNIQQSFGDAGILVRAKSVSPINDGGEQYSFTLHPGHSVVKMAKMSGIWTHLTDAAHTISYNTDYKLRIECIGDLFTVYLNNAFIFNYSDSSYEFGSIGLRTFHTKVIYKSLRIMVITPNNTFISSHPTISPSNAPSASPSIQSMAPSFHSFAPSNIPSNMPPNIPSNMPSMYPTNQENENEVNDLTTTVISNTSFGLKSSSLFRSRILLLLLILVVLCLIICLFILALKFIQTKKIEKHNNENDKNRTELVRVASHSNNVNDLKKQKNKYDEGVKGNNETQNINTMGNNDNEVITNEDEIIIESDDEHSFIVSDDESIIITEDVNTNQ